MEKILIPEIIFLLCLSHGLWENTLKIDNCYVALGPIPMTSWPQLMALHQPEFGSLYDGTAKHKGSCCISEQTYPRLTVSPLHQIGHAWHDRLRLLGSLKIFWRSLNIFLQLFEVCNITDIGSLRGLLKLLCWFFFCMIRFIESSLSLLWLVTHRPFISLFSQQTEDS